MTFAASPRPGRYPKGLMEPFFVQGDPKKSIRVWLSISQQLFVKYKRNVLHRRNEILT